EWEIAPLKLHRGHMHESVARCTWFSVLSLRDSCRTGAVAVQRRWRLDHRVVCCFIAVAEWLLGFSSAFGAQLNRLIDAAFPGSHAKSLLDTRAGTILAVA